jgi:oxygen-independent coproporphyrinogen-3 oxidase
MTKAGIYIHIPFCKSRCSYCDFATDVYRNNEAVERYVSALCLEISDSGFQISDSVETIYFGGGTPSLLTAQQLEKILRTLHQKVSVAPNIEFTLEMNPATVTLEKLLDFKSLGVNRASFGVQTFDDRALKLLARGHNADDARKTFELLREANFENISFDLIAGLPNQTLPNWEDNLSQALDLQPEHLSLYLLEIHESTPLAEQIRSKRQPLPDEFLAAEMYELMLEKTAEKGYAQYEISNFSRPEFESRHNSKYWLCEPVFAFGVSAHSFDGKKRWANERDTNKYVQIIARGESPVVEINPLTKKQLSAEFAFLNLRLTKGLDLNLYKSRFAIDLETEFAEDLKRLMEAELIEFSQGRLKLTRRGMVYSNEVFSIFV